jgi:hypothetical protein
VAALLDGIASSWDRRHADGRVGQTRETPLARECRYEVEESLPSVEGLGALEDGKFVGVACACMMTPTRDLGHVFGCVLDGDDLELRIGEESFVLPRGQEEEVAD